MSTVWVEMLKKYGEEEPRLFENIQEAISSAKSLGLRDLEFILRMALLELGNHHLRELRALNGEDKLVTQ